MASKPNQELWKHLIDKSDTEALSRRFVTHATKLYAFEHPIEISILPTEEIFMYDRLALYQIMRGIQIYFHRYIFQFKIQFFNLRKKKKKIASKQVPINPFSAVLSLGRQFPISFSEIRQKSNPITRFLFKYIEGDEFD